MLDPDRSESPSPLERLLGELRDPEALAAIIVELKACGDESTPNPEETTRLAHEIIARAERHTGARVSDVRVFPHFGRFLVNGRADILRDVIAQPEVAGATPNEMSGPGLVEPPHGGER